MKNQTKEPQYGPAAFNHLPREFSVRPKRVIEGEMFTRQVDVTDPGLAFRGCTFNPDGQDRFCVKVHPGARFTQFLECDFSGAQSKAILGDYLSVKWCHFHDIGEDGVYAYQDGYIEVLYSVFERMGWLPGAHADPVQFNVGSHGRIIGNHMTASLDPDRPWTFAPNSGGCYVKSIPRLGPPPTKIAVARNILDNGALYLVRVTATPGVNVPQPEDVNVWGNKVGRYTLSPFVVDDGNQNYDQATVDLWTEHNDMTEAVRYRP